MSADDDVAYPEAPIFRSPILIGAAGTQILAGPETNEAIAEAIAGQGGVVLHDVLEPGLLQSFIGLAARADFREVDSGPLGVRTTDMSVSLALPFCVALARRPFMRWLEAISGCPPVDHIEGHLAQMLPGNAVGWHRDTGSGTRRLAMVINLTTAPVEGARFELRRKADREPMLAYHASAPGSLAIFRTDGELQHRVSRLLSGGPRRSFSAWARGPRGEMDTNRDFTLATWPPLPAIA